MKALLAFGALTAVSFGSWALDQDVFAASPHTDAAAAHKSAPAAQATKATNRHGKTAMRASVSASIHSQREKVKAPCFRDAVTVVHFAEEDTFPLTRCDGSVAHLAVERLSVLARPGSAPKPQTDPSALAKMKGDKIAPGIRRLDPKLVERIESMIEHFSKGKPARLEVISGYRPGSHGSYHATGRALDVRLDGVANEALVAFCKTLPDTGCGYYPNSSFMHVDIREPGTGHVTWIDASGPGESPRYVSAWPPPADASPNRAPEETSPAAVGSIEEALAKLDRGLPPLPADEHSSAGTAREPGSARESKDADEEESPTPPKHADHDTPASPASPTKGTPRFQL